MARDPNLEYKEKKKKDVVDRIEVELSGAQSGALTGILNRYKKIEKLIKNLTEARETMNEDIKTRVESLFDVTDEIYTRVVETVSAALSLAKKSETTKEVFDLPGYIKHLEQIAKLSEADLNTIKETFTKIENVAPKSPKLTVKIKESRSDILDKIESYSNKVATLIRKDLNYLDVLINKLKKKN